VPVNIRVLDPKSVVRHVARVMVDDLEVTYDLLELLEELEGTGDGLFQRLVLYSDDQVKDLERRGLASRHNKGSYYAGPKLGEWLKAAHQAGIGSLLVESAQRARFQP
jgi:hypothetical protein